MKKKCGTIIFLSVLLLAISAGAKNKKYEKEYQREWCAEKSGRAEVVLPDRTRCDCLTQDNAIEFDFGRKWAEAIGQSLYYGLQTGKKPGVVLILESIKDRKYWIRMNSTIEHYKLPIDTWKIENF